MYYLVYYPVAGIGAFGIVGIILLIVTVVALLGGAATIGFSWTMMPLDLIASMIDRGWWIWLLVILAVCAAVNWFMGDKLQSWFPLAPLAMSAISWGLFLLIALVADIMKGGFNFWETLLIMTIGLLLFTLMFFPLFLGFMALTSPAGVKGGGKEYVLGALCTFASFTLGMLALQAGVECVWGWFGAAEDVALHHVGVLDKAMELFFDDKRPLVSGTWLTEPLLQGLRSISRGWRFWLCLAGCVVCTIGERKFVPLMEDLF